MRWGFAVDVADEDKEEDDKGAPIAACEMPLPTTRPPPAALAAAEEGVVIEADAVAAVIVMIMMALADSVSSIGG